jgi:hypothetical protein
MVNSTETNSTKSSISGKAASLKKSVQKATKTIARPFKKLKKSISTASIPSIRSRSPSISDNEYGNEPSTDGQDDGGGIDPEVELTPQEELSTWFNYLVIYTNDICIRRAPGALALTHLHLLQI